MSNPFLSVHVQPSYGRNKAIIAWTVATGYSNADFYVYKSLTKGTPPWTLLNTVPAKAGMYEDTDLKLTDNPYYRVLMIKAGQEYDSPVVSAFDKLSKLQYGGVSKMMGLEYKRMSSGNGLQILHYIPLADGELDESVDPLTGQQYGIACPETDDNFGTKFKGGYGPPMYTWMEITKYGEDEIKEGDNNLDVDDSLKHKARLLAFPVPKPGDLIIHPPTDNRYAVMSPVQGNLFRGVCPISYDVEIQLLRRTDARYRIQVPAELPTPLWAQI